MFSKYLKSNKKFKNFREMDFQERNFNNFFFVLYSCCWKMQYYKIQVLLWSMLYSIYKITYGSEKYDFKSY